MDKEHAQELFKNYTIHEKRYGDRAGIEDVVISKRRFQYEEVSYYDIILLYSAARLVSRVKRSQHITPILRDLHWLEVQLRIRYKVILTFKALHGMCPEYISDLLTPYIPPRRLRSSSQHLLNFNHGATKT